MRIKELELILQREEIAAERAERYKKFEQRDLTWPQLKEEHQKQCRVMGYHDLAGDTTITFTDSEWLQRDLYLNGEYTQADYTWSYRLAAMYGHAWKFVCCGIFALYLFN